MKYYILDKQLYCFVGLTHMYLHIIGGEIEPKICKIKDNLHHLEIMEMHPETTKAEFEATLPSTTLLDCIYKASYLMSVSQQIVMSN